MLIKSSIGRERRRKKETERESGRWRKQGRERVEDGESERDETDSAKS